MTAAVLRGSPRDLGLEEPSANPNNVFGEAGQSAAPVPLAALILPLLESPVFWSICGINFGLTLIREAFITWSPNYLKDVADLSAGMAGIASLVFPLAGGVSAIVAGLLSDRLQGRHGLVVVPSLVLATGSLYAMGVIDVDGKPWAAMTLIAVNGFLLIGPYSYLSRRDGARPGRQAGQLDSRRAARRRRLPGGDRLRVWSGADRGKISMVRRFYNAGGCVRLDPDFRPDILDPQRATPPSASA